MEKSKISFSLNKDQLQIIAIAAMTLDHVMWLLYPGFSRIWWVAACHAMGRITAPTMWYFIAEGYDRTRDVRKYAERLLIFAFISHFAYNFFNGHSFIPFEQGLLNQTSVIWPLLWGLIGIGISESTSLKQWQKVLAILGICLITLISDWGCIPVLAIIWIHDNKNDFKKMALGLELWVFVYSIVYFFAMDKLYAIIQLFICLSFPLLRAYNGERGKGKGMKWLFYIYYPAHLVLLGIIRILINR